MGIRKLVTRSAAKRRPDWAAVACRLAEVLPRERLHPAVLAWAESAEATRSRASWGIAFSGGADSLALLLLLWAHFPKKRARLLALHFDHRLRGAASRADAVFCRQVCAALGVRFVAGRWPGDHRDASEAEARAARFAFFAKHVRILWFGHQQDDIAETMLMRLARGSGAGGLAAPRPVHRLPGGRVHLRPLLTLKKTELAAALTALGVPWREDSTNGRADFFRNRIRHAVLPAWVTAAGRDAVAGAARARELLEEDEAALEARVDTLAPLTAAGALSLAVLAGEPRAILRRALHRWLCNESRAGELSRQAFDALLAAIERGRPTRQSLGREGFAVIAADRLRFEPERKTRRNFERRAN